jgi:endoplasmic reticulum-Golgi intermediate compartment protein 3
MSSASTLHAAPAGVYQYYLKVVPTSYTTLRNATTESSQYSVTEHFRPLSQEMMVMMGQAPAVIFQYDLSAIKVRLAPGQLEPAADAAASATWGRSRV